MKYASKLYPELEVDIKEVKKDTVLKSAIYGDILITKGNYILTFQDGQQVGINKADLEVQYEPAKTKSDK